MILFPAGARMTERPQKTRSRASASTSRIRATRIGRKVEPARVFAIKSCVLAVLPEDNDGMKTVQSEVPTAVNPHECILWDGATNGGGYPQVYHDGKKKLVSHLIWEEETGQSVPKGMYICHDC